MATKTSRIPRNMNFLGETAFWGGNFCLEYPSRHSEKVNCHFVNYRLSFCKLQIFISQTTDFHFTNYRFSFGKPKVLISQTTDFHFANYRFSFRFANYSKPYDMTFVNGVCPISRPNTAKKTSCEISGLSAWNVENKISFTVYSNALADSFGFIRTQLTTHLWSMTGSLKTLALRQSYTLQGYMLLKLSFAWKPGYLYWSKQLFILRWWCPSCTRLFHIL